ncbi:MAG TPA: hypothetical protein VKB79_18480 [Bryobacteraceae bacterium]|nr:hypothetical protein [Bryobacteraceae bacterium]
MAVPKTQGLTSAVSVPVAPGTTTGNQPFGGGSFVGTLTITGFQVVNGALNAVGTVTGNLLDSAGNQVGSTITQAVSIPVAASGSCPILNLTLGPLDLNVLGLVVHLNQVVLNITAVPGAGNLLGNLLCSVANLLNGGSPLSTLATNLAALLNQVLAAL